MVYNFHETNTVTHHNVLTVTPWCPPHTGHDKLKTKTYKMSVPGNRSCYHISLAWLKQRMSLLYGKLNKELKLLGQCATGNPVPVTVDPVDFFRSGSGPAKYWPDRPDLASKFGCRIWYHVTFCMFFLAFLNTIKIILENSILKYGLKRMGPKTKICT